MGRFPWITIKKGDPCWYLDGYVKVTPRNVYGVGRPAVDPTSSLVRLHIDVPSQYNWDIVDCDVKAILRLFIYKALYLGSKTTMTTVEWSCLISFAWYPLTSSERRGGSEKFKMKIFVSSGIRTHRLATTRLVEQRFRPFGYDTLMKIWRLISYWIVG